MNLSEIASKVKDLADTIGASAKDLPTFGHSEDGARPHIEVIDETYHYVIVEKGTEYDRQSTLVLDELMYWIFSFVTFSMAMRYELQNRAKGVDFRRLLFAKQISLLAMLSSKWAEKSRLEQGEVLREHPFNDKI